MKFEEWAFFDILSLLKEVDDHDVWFFGGSPKFIHFLNSKCQGSIHKSKIWEGRNRSHDEYALEIPLFKKMVLEFYSLQQNWFNQWAKLSNLRKLVLLLEFVFDRNKLAHDNYQRSRKHTQFSKKNQYLIRCLNYALDIRKVPFFRFGKQYDNTPNYPVILYFEFGDHQISFHSNIECIDYKDKVIDIPDFEGKWNGIINQVCPIDLRKIIHLLIKNNVDESKICRSCREKMYELDETLLESKLQQKTKIKREVKIDQNLPVIVENSQKIQTQKRFKTLSNFF